MLRLMLALVDRANSFRPRLGAGSRGLFAVLSALAMWCTVGCAGDVASPRSGGPQALPVAPPSSVPGPNPSVPVEPAVAGREPGPAVLARLTRAQYGNVVADLFGVQLEATALEADTRPYNFSVIGASGSGISVRGVDLYRRSAISIAAALFAEEPVRTALIPCLGTDPLERACLSEFVESLGLRAFRRPLEPDERERYVTLGLRASGAEPYDGPRAVVAALLQSPYFLYRVELGEPAPEQPGWSRYTSYEMAARLSFLMRNSLPDASLLAAAAGGSLATREGVREEALRLRAEVAPTRAMVRGLFQEYLDLPLLGAVEFPESLGSSATVAASMQEEVLSMVARIALEEQADMRSLFTTRRTLVDDRLASLYGVPPPAGGALLEVELAGDGPRAGLLTTGALLTIHNRPNRTSPTLRGFFIRQRLLCGSVPPPPPDAPPLVEAEGPLATTVRERLVEHATNPACSVCHKTMDPIGLGLEAFDQYGRHRTAYENGAPVDSTGDVDGVPFNGARGLGELLARDERVSACLVKQLYRYASSRVDTLGERGLLEELAAKFASSGYLFPSLVLELVQSDGFRYFNPEAP
jgi:hypothetical protein